MAKKKSADMPVAALEEWSPTIYLDVKSLKDLEDLTVGEPVTVVLQGKVKSLEQRDDGSKVKGSISLTDYSVKITGKSELEELMEDDDD